MTRVVRSTLRIRNLTPRNCDDCTQALEKNQSSFSEWRAYPDRHNPTNITLEVVTHLDRHKQEVLALLVPIVDSIVSRLEIEHTQEILPEIRLQLSEKAIGSTPLDNCPDYEEI